MENLISITNPKKDKLLYVKEQFTQDFLDWTIYENGKDFFFYEEAYYSHGPYNSYLECVNALDYYCKTELAEGPGSSYEMKQTKETK